VLIEVSRTLTEETPAMSLATLPCAILQTHFSFSGYSKSGRFFRDGLYLAFCFEAFFSFRRLVRENWRIPGAFARMPLSTIWKTVSPTKKLEARAWLAAAEIAGYCGRQ
jgi:hypothetical protein